MPWLKGPTLTGRDTAVLLDVYKYRYLSVSQIARLHFPSRQTAYRRLRALTELKLLVGFTTATTTEHLYYLGRHGAEAVADTLGVPLPELRWSEISRPPKDYYFVSHFLAVTDFRITLNQTCAENNLQLLGFIPEYLGNRKAPAGLERHIRNFVCDIHDVGIELNHTPDAVFAMSKEGQPALFFLEIDRGTEVVSNAEKGVLKACRFYLNYLLAGDYQRYGKDFGCGPFKGFRTLIVTSSEARLQNIRTAVTSLPFAEKAKRFIWAVVASEINQTISGSVWRSVDLSDTICYRIL